MPAFFFGGGGENTHCLLPYVFFRTLTLSYTFFPYVIPFVCMSGHRTDFPEHYICLYHLSVPYESYIHDASPCICVFVWCTFYCSTNRLCISSCKPYKPYHFLTLPSFIYKHACQLIYTTLSLYFQCFPGVSSFHKAICIFKPPLKKK